MTMNVYNFEPANNYTSTGSSTGNGSPPDNTDMEHRITALETRLDTVLPTLATKADLADLRTEMHKGFGDIIKWIVGTGFVGLAAMITIITFVLNNAVPKTPAAPQPPAIIINVPANSPAPLPAPMLQNK